MNNERNDWVEVYRPETIEDCILTNTIHRKAEAIIKNDWLQNLLLVGDPGCGKTCFIQSLINDIDAESQWWNSQEIKSIRKGLDSGYINSMSLFGRKKTVVLDEFDLASKNIQKVLLKPMEGNGISAWFLIANDISSMDKAIISRTTTLDFTIPEAESEEMKIKCFDRCRFILTEKNITFNADTLGQYIDAYFPGFRKIINELQAGVDADNYLLPV